MAFPPEPGRERREGEGGVCHLFSVSFSAVTPAQSSINTGEQGTSWGTPYVGRTPRAAPRGRDAPSRWPAARPWPRGHRPGFGRRLLHCVAFSHVSTQSPAGWSFRETETRAARPRRRSGNAVEFAPLNDSSPRTWHELVVGPCCDPTSQRPHCSTPSLPKLGSRGHESALQTSQRPTALRRLRTGQPGLTLSQHAATCTPLPCSPRPPSPTPFRLLQTRTLSHGSAPPTPPCWQRRPDIPGTAHPGGICQIPVT